MLIVLKMKLSRVDKTQLNSIEAIHHLVPLLPTSKSQKRRISIIEGALRCYAKLGIEKTTFDQIAKEAKTSRLLNHQAKIENFGVIKVHRARIYFKLSTAVFVIVVLRYNRGS